MKANVVFRVVLLTCIVALLLAPFSGAIIDIASYTYALGHDVTISLNLSSMDGYRLDIQNDNTVFSYIGKDIYLTFTPKSEGKYAVSLVNVSTGSVIDSVQFFLSSIAAANRGSSDSSWGK